MRCAAASHHCGSVSLLFLSVQRGCVFEVQGDSFLSACCGWLVSEPLHPPGCQNDRDVQKGVCARSLEPIIDHINPLCNQSCSLPGSSAVSPSLLPCRSGREAAAHGQHFTWHWRPDRNLELIITLRDVELSLSLQPCLAKECDIGP